MELQGQLYSNIIPTPEEMDLATKNFMSDSAPFIQRLFEIKAMKTPMIVKDFSADEIMFIEPEDSREEIEIKKAIELLRQKHFPNFTV